MKILRFLLPMMMGATIAILMVDRYNSLMEVEVAQVTVEPMICGTPRLQQFVDNWTLRNNYVIDLTHGGVYETWYCRPIDKEMPVNTGIGRD